MFASHKKKTEITVRGYKVKRMGALTMLQSIESLEEVIKGVMAQVINAGSSLEILDGIVALAAKTVSLSIPGIADWLSTVSGIPLEVFDDPDFGLGGLAETFAAVVEVNEFELFFGLALPAAKTVWQGISKGFSGASASPANP